MTQSLLQRSGSDKQPAEGDAQWQKHVFWGLWVVFGIFVVLVAVLMWGGFGGAFEFVAGQGTSPSWPTGWP